MRNGSLLLSVAALFAAVHLWSPRLWAQDDENSSEISNSEASSDVDQIAAEIEKKATKKEMPSASDVEKDEKLEDFSGLGKLAPFSEVSIIQKRFLPKSRRFQFFLGLTDIVNDPWFNGIGFDGRLAYHLTEAWGAELSYSYLSNSKRQSAKDLYDEHGVTTDSIISTTGYYGAALQWTPIYGKMGWLNRRIIPFDMYFQLGAGNTQVENGNGGNTLHIGTGQIFALSKSMGFRWDFSWNALSATPTGKSAQSFNNLLLSFGWSFFFPGVNYR